MGIDQQKTIRIIRLTLTCLILFLVTWYYQVPERIWSIITVWFVMTEYTSVGGVYRKGFYRFVGTFVSAIYGLVVIYCFENNVVINMMAFVAGAFIYMYYFLDGDKTYIAVIGSVTLSIVLLNHNDLDSAILRTLNIIIGILSSMFMIRFFYPKYARDEVIEEQAKFIKQLAGIVEIYLDSSRSLETLQQDYFQYELSILAGLASFERHISEAKIETGPMSPFIHCNRAALVHIRHLFRLLSVFLNYLTTDDIRADEWVVSRLNELLWDLRVFQSMLEDHEILPRPLETISLDNERNLSVKTILNTMKQEVDLLDEQIKTIVLIEEEYHMNKNIKFWRKGGKFFHFHA